MPSPMDIFVKEMQELFCPDEVYIMDGSQLE
jgi:GTP-dependent phosphoenolpyruvate carboxykinase